MPRTTRDLGPKDSRFVEVDRLPWEPSRFPGVETKTLFIDKQTGSVTALIRLAPGARLPDHEHPLAEQSLRARGRAGRRRRPLRRRQLRLAAGRQPPPRRGRRKAAWCSASSRCRTGSSSRAAGSPTSSRRSGTRPGAPPATSRPPAEAPVLRDRAADLRPDAPGMAAGEIVIGFALQRSDRRAGRRGDWPWPGPLAVAGELPAAAQEPIRIGSLLAVHRARGVPGRAREDDPRALRRPAQRRGRGARPAARAGAGAELGVRAAAPSR